MTNSKLFLRVKEASESRVCTVRHVVFEAANLMARIHRCFSVQVSLVTVVVVVMVFTMMVVAMIVVLMVVMRMMFMAMTVHLAIAMLMPVVHV